MEFFGEKKGFEVDIVEINVPMEKKPGCNRERTKKAGFISNNSFSAGKNCIVDPLKKDLRIDILKKTMTVRKQIANLQISQKKTEDDLLWESSKLENDVVSKINGFIALSHVDEQQSYINFKHTVNLETIKGIENVIEEQTETYMEQQRIITNYLPKEEGAEKCPSETSSVASVDKKRRLLEINIDAIMEHLSKIKVFGAWKKSLKKNDMTALEWRNFNKNAEKILESKVLQHSLNEIDKLRANYL